MCRELNLHRSTLTKRLKSSDVQAGKDGKYSTADIFRGLSGDLNTERIAKIRAERELLELELEHERGQVANLSDMELAWSGIVVALRQVIKGSSMSQAEKERCLKEIRESLTADIVRSKDGNKAQPVEHTQVS